MNQMDSLFPDFLVSPRTDLEYLRKTTKIKVASPGTDMNWVRAGMKHD
jgi:hypothetical protein